MELLLSEFYGIKRSRIISCKKALGVRRGGLMVSALFSNLRGSVVLGSCARHSTLDSRSVSLHPGVQLEYRHVSANLNGGVEIFLVATCYRNREKASSFGLTSHLARVQTYLYFQSTWSCCSKELKTRARMQKPNVEYKKQRDCFLEIIKSTIDEN